MRKRVLFNDNRINRTSTPAIGFISLISPSLYGRNSIYHLKHLYHSLPPKRKKSPPNINDVHSVNQQTVESFFIILAREIKYLVLRIL